MLHFSGKITVFLLNISIFLQISSIQTRYQPFLFFKQKSDSAKESPISYIRNVNAQRPLLNQSYC